MLTTRMAAVATVLLGSGASIVGLGAVAAPDATAAVCGDYTHNGARYFANCVGHGQEVRYHEMFPPAPFNYVCVPAGESVYIGPDWKVWGVFVTGDSC